MREYKLKNGEAEMKTKIAFKYASCTKKNLLVIQGKPF